MEINVKEMREAQKKFQSLAHFLAMAKLKQAWALLICLNENALKVTQGHLMFTSRFALVVF